MKIVQGYDMTGIDVARASKIFERVAADSQPSMNFFGMVILSCTVATYGLLSDSTAVVIGAMLLAPLMGPILGGALGIATESNALLSKSLVAEFSGAVVAVLLSAFLTAVLPDAPVTPEIIGRTTPTLLDLIIALASGVAGTYAVCSKKTGSALPGVAIATALMPPLCVTGIGLAKHDYNIASGAALLFAANFIAINVAALATFEFFGISRKIFNDRTAEEGEMLRKPLRKMLLPVVLLVLISVPLAIIMYRTYHSAYIDKILRASMTEALENIAPGGTLISTDYKLEQDKFKVNAAFRLTRVLQPEDVRKIENLLELRLGAPAQVDADVVLVQKISHSNNFDAYGKIVSEYEKKPAREVVRVETPEEIVENVVREKLQLLKNVQLADFMIQYRRSAGEYQVTLMLTGGESEQDSAFVKATRALLEDRLKRRVKVTVAKPY